MGKTHGILTMIDNTFASPINQTPLDFGIDVCIHSATKYLGGHSDISAGAVVSTPQNIDMIWNKAKNLGGHLSDFIAYLLERSIKTLAVRVDRHNSNAQALAEYLENHDAIEKVFYPGLPSHSTHAIAKKQMHGFGGMLSFELKSKFNAVDFQNNLKLIKPSMSLAGVESTILLPSLTSHGLLTLEQRQNMGVSDNLLRFSVGIEDVKDIIEDMEQAFTVL